MDLYRKVRLACAEALRSAITPGCTVLDLGAGFGAFSFLACRFGAGRVIAVEPASAIALGAEMARANGCADRIEFIRGVSQDLGPEVQADVILADLRGPVPLYTQHIPTIVDARSRLLAPGGVLITQRDHLRCALVSDEAIAGNTFRPWQANALNLDFSAGNRIAVNTEQKLFVGPEAVFSDTVDFATLDYHTITDPDVRDRVTLTAERAAPAHGLLVWFDAELTGGQGFSNAPGQPKRIYGHLFLPFERPVEMAEGDSSEIDLGFRLVGDRYEKTWKSRFLRAGKPDLKFSQSTALAEFITAADLRRRVGSYVPQPKADMDLDRHCLSRFDGATPLDTIARELVERAPGRFVTQADALAYAAALAERYHEPS
ncbi:50S ribosomal protein L11 methyltransferase [Mameliella alba]|uniref:50S ribosomal protein L11 methyltransferase n=1 Tax=Mameliella alba TaxID=561184 RepID=UPI0013FDC0EE|nr:50S ribosomal protein L11 methyltransferase [Mameliella alba]